MVRLAHGPFRPHVLSAGSVLTHSFISSLVFACPVETVVTFERPRNKTITNKPCFQKKFPAWVLKIPRVLRFVFLFWYFKKLRFTYTYSVKNAQANSKCQELSLG